MPYATPTPTWVSQIRLRSYNVINANYGLIMYQLQLKIGVFLGWADECLGPA